MGNNISGPTTRTSLSALDAFVSDLGGDIVYEKSLGSGRFLKTVKARHKHGSVVIKIFIKPDPGISLRNYRKRLKTEREALVDLPNVYNYQTFFETDKAGYMIRQWLLSSLYDRISTRPFLSIIEKKWIAFQILTGLQAARERKISHGDIKSENIMVTSWNWVYITDFGSIKPVFIPEDDPTDYSFYFDTSGRRTCYIAPERFFSDGSDVSRKKQEMDGSSIDADKRDGKINEAMDVFSAGCVIAEVFLDGKATFTLSQLFKYRAGERNMLLELAKIPDEGIRSLVISMLALEPASRPTFSGALRDARGNTFPDSFYTFLHQYIASVNDVGVPVTSSTSPFNRTGNASAGNPSTEHVPAQAGISHSDSVASIPSDSDSRMEKIWSDFDELEPYLVEDNSEATIMELKVSSGATSYGTPIQDVFPVQLAVPNRSPAIRGGLVAGQKAAAEDGPALIVLSLVTANLRNCSLPTSKLRALDLLLAIACHLTDEAKLDRLVPYIIDLLHDDAAPVRTAAIRTLVQVTMLVSAITPDNMAIFPEYILPNIWHLTRDVDVSVRCAYAQCIAPLADTSLRYLEMGQALKAHGTLKLPADHDDNMYDISYDTARQDLHALIQEQLVTLLFDPSSVVKRAALHDMDSLCSFLGRQTTNDLLLSHMITYLNDRDWALRWAFFDGIVVVATNLVQKDVEEYILPLLIQALSDVEEAVVAKVLSALTNLSDLSLFPKMRIWELMSATIGFLYHPNIWIRQGAAAFISSAAKKLPTTDVWCILYPSLRPHLRSDVRAISESSLLMTVKPPLPRKIFDAAVAWAMKGDKSQFWKGSLSRSRSTKSEYGKDGVTNMKRSTTLGSSKSGLPRSDEDAIQIAKLQQLGMTAIDETKLIALRDYTLKLANAILSSQREKATNNNPLSVDGNSDVELQRLGITPQTVFLGGNNAPRSLRTEQPSRRGTPASGNGPSLSRLANHEPPARDGTVAADLRRRHTQIDDSAASLHAPNAFSIMRSRRDSLSSVASAMQSPTPTDSSSLHALHSPFDLMPGSPSESVMSAGMDALRGKLTRTAPPVVGSVHANISGVLEAPKLHSAVDEIATSGRTSPMSMAGTIRVPSRKVASRTGSVQPATAYEPGITNVLDAIYHDNFRDPTTDFGPRIHQGPVRRRTPARSSFPARDYMSKKSDTTLIAHLSSHTGQVNGIAVAPDHAFFVTCSDDQTVKIWDTARLERNVTSKPRHSYTQHHAPVTCVCMLEASHCFASAANDGSLHVVRVQLTQNSSMPKYKQLQVVREHRVERGGEYITCMTHYNTETTSNLVYGTTHANVVILDLRTMRIVHAMDDARHHGPITSLCLDRKRAWLVTGSLRGVLTLWDLRFGLRLKSWKVTAAEGASPGEAVRIHQCLLHPTKGRGRWIIVAVETQTMSDAISTYTPGVVLVEVWDIEKGIMVETFVTQQPLEQEDTPSSPSLLKESFKEGLDSRPIATSAIKTPAEAIAALVKAQQQAQSEPSNTRSIEEPSPHLAESDLEAEDRRRAREVGVRAMVAGSDFGGLTASGVRLARSEGPDGYYAGMNSEGSELGPSRTGGFLLTGSEDRKIRLWDLGKVDRSMVISGMELDHERPAFRTIQPTNATEPSSAPSPTPSSIHTESYLNHTSKLDRPSLRTSLIGHHQQQLLKGHQDCITALACIDVPFRCGVVSGDRTGVVKVFRVETE
ncbi:Serine/threonine-protein kinase [Tulasnella sp. 330]|nr:Serine/threonine-protein kinase [Tulasnella sp. 330]KAG8881593.1 Serine/threonine-protein kinase [Tulasnella sp. 331]